MIVLTGIFSFCSIQSGTIKGTVSPSEAARTVWTISGTDTLKATINNGSFDIMNVNAGTYKIVVEAASPYKNKVLDNITVMDGNTTDVGIITLEKGTSDSSIKINK